MPTPTRFETRPPMLVGGLRQHHDFAAAEVGIAEQLRRFKALGVTDRPKFPP